MYYEEDYEPNYYEPSVADDILMEYREKMKVALLDSVKNDIESLKKENEDLKEQYQKLKQKENEVRDREWSLEIDKKNLLRTVRQERLSTLMKDFQIVMYKADRVTVKPPKCDKCDSQRKLKFKTPSGRIMDEYCECNTGKYVYTPKKHICSEFSLDEGDSKISMWFKITQEGKDNECYSSEISNYMKTVYKAEMEYKTIDPYNTFFKTKEECQKYCNFENETKETK